MSHDKGSFLDEGPQGGSHYRPGSIQPHGISSIINRGGIAEVIVKITADNGLVGWGECTRAADTAGIRRGQGDGAAHHRPQRLGQGGDLGHSPLCGWPSSR